LRSGVEPSAEPVPRTSEAARIAGSWVMPLAVELAACGLRLIMYRDCQRIERSLPKGSLLFGDDA
jgi:hypothetical protein